MSKKPGWKNINYWCREYRIKLCLRLIERGANIEVYRRDKKLSQICQLINFIKPAGNKSRAKPFFPKKNKFKNLML